MSQSENTTPISNLPMNLWIDICSLNSDQLEALIHGDVKCEWNLGFKNGREVQEVKITNA